jgi:hypothetical protein
VTARQTTGKTGFSAADVYLHRMRASSLSNESLYCYHYTLADGDDGGGVSRARSAACAIRREFPCPVAIGCELPNTRRVIRAVSSSVATASRRSSSVALESL